MLKNPLVTMILGLMVGMLVGYVMAEMQTVPPAGAPPAPARGDAADLPEGHPPIDTGAAAGGSNAAVEAQVSELSRMLEANPDDARLMVAIGNLYFDAGMWADARTWYERALETSPGDPDVITDLAVVYRSLQQPERAIELLRQAIEREPDHWQAWYNQVVVLHFDLHQHDAADQALRRLEEIAEDNPDVPDLSALRREVRGG